MNAIACAQYTSDSHLSSALPSTQTYQTIVLARCDMGALRDTGRTERRDGNYFPVFEAAKRAVACVWLNKGTAADLARAEAYAKAEGFTVITFPTNEPDPLGKAKAMMLA